ncbi:hypothetical protein [Pseudomonas fluorescens]|uniref:hypothetical protein n=1 Tax=Pseudomonas fluorescens TaxID=294 RepID=UPI001242D859|nr:hypothetical protein [Pseudomonas fluorescens]
MSTLNEIAANHARMAQALVEAPVEPSERHSPMVQGFEAPPTHAQPYMPLHLLAGMKDNHPAQVTGYLL